jgi:hypothetical protein
LVVMLEQIVTSTIVATRWRWIPPLFSSDPDNMEDGVWTWNNEERVQALYTLGEVSYCYNTLQCIRLPLLALHTKNTKAPHIHSSCPLLFMLLLLPFIYYYYSFRCLFSNPSLAPARDATRLVTALCESVQTTQPPATARW